MNKKNIMLAKNKTHSSVFLCQHGVVHCNWINVGIKFTPKDLVNFALLVNEAYHKLEGLNGENNWEPEFKKLNF